MLGWWELALSASFYSGVFSSKNIRLSGLQGTPQWDPAGPIPWTHTSRDSGLGGLGLAEKSATCLFLEFLKFPGRRFGRWICWHTQSFFRNLQRSDLLNMTPKPECLITYLGVGPLVRSDSTFNGRVEHWSPALCLESRDPQAGRHGLRYIELQGLVPSVCFLLGGLVGFLLRPSI